MAGETLIVKAHSKVIMSMALDECEKTSGSKTDKTMKQTLVVLNHES